MHRAEMERAAGNSLPQTQSGREVNNPRSRINGTEPKDPRTEALMNDKVYKKIEIVGTSSKGYEDAIQNAIAQAKKSVQGMSWFEVTEMRGNLQASEIVFQVTVKVGFQVLEA